MAGINVALEPKTSTFQMRISPKVKAKAEKIFSNCGMTLTDAINAFIQQSINVEGMPFLITQNGKDAVRSLALSPTGTDPFGLEEVMQEIDKIHTHMSMTTIRRDHMRHLSIAFSMISFMETIRTF